MNVNLKTIAVLASTTAFLLQPAAGKGILGGIVGGAVGGAVGKAVGKDAAQPDISKSLEQAAAQLNKVAPTMVDERTRLDGVTSGPGHTLTYRHTLIDLRARDADMAFFNGEFARGLRSKICGNTGMSALFKAGVTTVYAYQGNDGASIGSVRITPQTCGH